MRKFLAVLLAGVLLLGLCGCQSAPEQPTTEAATEVTTAPEQQTEAPTETLPPEGALLLTVSEITLRLVGDSEDLYVGTAPREAITWSSADESIATFENGTLTAAGVGDTTVTAAFGDTALTVTVHILAQDEEALKSVSKKLLHAPSRIPPVADDTPCTFFDDAAFVGDSISYTLQHRSPATGVIGNPTYLVRGGVSLNGFVMGSKKITLRGTEIDLEDAIAKTEVKKVFIMMGQNDLSYRTIEETMESWEIVLERIREKNPDVDIYIQSLVPEWHEHHLPNKKNEKIAEYNDILRVFAQDNDCRFVEIASYFQDSTFQMPDAYTGDHGIHINFTGADAWMQALRAYVTQLEAKGEI